MFSTLFVESEKKNGKGELLFMKEFLGDRKEGDGYYFSGGEFRWRGGWGWVKADQALLKVIQDNKVDQS